MSLGITGDSGLLGDDTEAATASSTLGVSRSIAGWLAGAAGAGEAGGSPKRLRRPASRMGESGVGTVETAMRYSSV